MQTPTLRIDRNIIIVLIVGSCIAYSGLSTMPLWIGALTDHMKLSPALPGYMGSVELLMAAMASIWVSGKIRIYSAVKLALWGTLLVLTANLGSAFSSSVPLLFLCRAVAGIGEGVLLANLNVTLSRTKNPGKLFAWSQTTIAIYSIGIFTIAPKLMAHYGIIGIFGLVALVAAIALLTVRCFPSTLPNRVKTEKRPRSLFSRLSSVPLLALGILFVGSQGIWAYFERMGVAKDFSVGQIGQYLMVGMVISLLGPLLANLFSVRYGYLKTIVMGLLVTSCAILLASQDISAIYYQMAAGIYPTSALFTMTGFLGYLAHLDKSGKMVASAPAYINLGGAIGPALMGFVLSVGGYALIGLVVTISYIMVVFLLTYKSRQYAS